MRSMDVAELIRKAKEYTKVDEEKILKAYHFAEMAHAGQTRMSGEPYITHPLAVAEILTKYKADEESLIAALLHDVVEDTEHRIEEIEGIFGKGVAKLVETLTKFTHVSAKQGPHLHEFDTKIESIRKIFEVMQVDVRVIVIKLCDRLHNMGTLGHFRPEKQHRIAQETLDIYVKIADRLCMNELKEELEEDCYRYLFPEKYALLMDLKRRKKASFEKTKKNIAEKLSESELINRASSVVIRQHIPFERITDANFEYLELVPEVFVILKSDHECYLALREIHSFWKNLNTTFHDYIAVPKSNGYRGLETTVIKLNGTLMRFIILTNEMYEYVRFGIATECFSDQLTRKKISLPWIEHLRRIHLETKNKSDEYMLALENDLLKGTITAYLSGNKILSLPARSTVLDAAFYGYEEEAWKLREAFINGNPASFHQDVHQDDTLICVFNGENQVKYEWLQWVDTAVGASYIKEYLQKSNRQKNIHHGKDLLNRVFLQEERGFIEELSNESLSEILTKSNTASLQDLYQKVGEGLIEAHDVVSPIAVAKNKGKHPMVLKVKGSSKEVLDLQDSVVGILRSPFELNVQGGGNDTVMTLVAKSVTSKQWKTVTNLVDRHDTIKMITNRPYGQRTKEIFFTVMISLFWGLDPVFASWIIKGGVEPVSLTLVRFVSAAVFLGLFLLVKSYLFKPNFRTKTLPFFQFQNFLLASFLFSVAIFSYLSLEATRPSYYILSLGAFAGYFFINDILRRNHISRWLILLASLFFISGFGLLYGLDGENWSTEARIFTVLAVVSFSLYSYFGERYQLQHKILARYDQLLLYITIYAAVFSVCLLGFFPFPMISSTLLLKAVAFSCVFTVMPYLLYHYLLKQTEDVALISYQLFGTVIVTFVAEIFILQLYPGIVELTVLATLYLSFFFFLMLSKKQPKA